MAALAPGAGVTGGHQPIRSHEVAIEAPLPADAALAFIGHIGAPSQRREDCLRQRRMDGPECAIVRAAPRDAALRGIERVKRLDILYRFHLSRRDQVLQVPRHGPGPRRPASTSVTAGGGENDMAGKTVRGWTATQAEFVAAASFRT